MSVGGEKRQIGRREQRQQGAPGRRLRWRTRCPASCTSTVQRYHRAQTGRCGQERCWPAAPQYAHRGLNDAHRDVAQIEHVVPSPHMEFVVAALQFSCQTDFLGRVSARRHRRAESRFPRWWAVISPSPASCPRSPSCSMTLPSSNCTADKIATKRLSGQLYNTEARRHD